MNIDIYTDGGAFRGENYAAWSFIIPGINPTDFCHCRNTYIGRSGLLSDSTHNGAEIMAVAFALEFVASTASRFVNLDSVTIHSDCNRPVDALNGLLEKWANNGWRTLSPAGKRKHAEGSRNLSEKDKWVFLYAQVKLIECLGLKINAIKIPSHSGIYWNEKCDSFVKSHLSIAAQGNAEDDESRTLNRPKTERSALLVT